MNIDETLIFEINERQNEGFIEHLQHIPILTHHNNKINQLIDEIAVAVSEHPNIKYTLQRIQYQYNLQKISEINEALVTGLQKKNYSAAEALSRVSLETTVNFLYILDEKTNERTNGLIQNYLKKNIYKAKKWLEYSRKTKDQFGIESANNLLQSMELGQSIFRFKNEAKPQKWPDTIKAKFEAVCMEDAYVTLFSSSSDSVHLGAEDIYNRTIVEFLGGKCREKLAKGVLNEKASFAIYLTICSLIYSTNSIIKLCNNINENSWKKTAEKIGKEFLKLKNEHETHHKLTT